jgi:hypothetical protein
LVIKLQDKESWPSLFKNAGLSLFKWEKLARNLSPQYNWSFPMFSGKEISNLSLMIKCSAGFLMFILASGIQPAKAGVDDDFANGKSIELATSNSLLRVNMYENRNGAPIFGLEPDGSSDQKFIVEWQPGYGFKLRKKDTNFYITTQKYPSPSLGLMEGWTKTADNNVASTFVALSSNKVGYYNICLKSQQSQCLNLPSQKRLARFTTYQRNTSDADQQFKPVSAGVVAPSSVIQRAKAWVDKGISYNQTAYYEGYRQDCSGFVSMAWSLPTSAVTGSLPNYAVTLSGKDNLLPGDAINNRQAGNNGHVVLFVQWIDKGTGKFVAYEENGGRWGKTVRTELTLNWKNGSWDVPDYPGLAPWYLERKK